MTPLLNLPHTDLYRFTSQVGSRLGNLVRVELIFCMSPTFLFVQRLRVYVTGQRRTEETWSRGSRRRLGFKTLYGSGWTGPKSRKGQEGTECKSGPPGPW